MAQNFFLRLREYYLDVAAVLRGEAKAAAIFPNSTDVGMSREQVYAEFLRQHAPSKCNVFFGGFIFGEDGDESKQMDVIITTDTTPRFNFHNREGNGKSFSPAEGTLGAVSIKSRLTKDELEDALSNIASIPHTKSLAGRMIGVTAINNYDDWPYKIIYATDGLSAETLLQHVNNFYAEHAEIPHFRRPNTIHVSGKYLLLRVIPGMGHYNLKTKVNTEYPVGTFLPVHHDPDLQGIVWTLHGLQERASASTFINFNYGEHINRVNGITPDKLKDNES